MSQINRKNHLSVHKIEPSTDMFDLFYLCERKRFFRLQYKYLKNLYRENIHLLSQNRFTKTDGWKRRQLLNETLIYKKLLRRSMRAYRRYNERYHEELTGYKTKLQK